MGNGWHEWPLVIFTVLGQCVVGALIVSGIGWFAARMTQTVSVLSVACFSWLLMGVRVYCLCHAPGIATAGV
ncbi:DmsC/YnfH family molybdoenzyme membrane anchor subunit [Escherichia coli]